MELRSDRLYPLGATNAFNGWLVEFHKDGSPRSRSAITNGQRQVTENFKEGFSQGARTKWFAGGAKLSEAAILNGQLHGTYRRWHENGAMAEQVEFNAGRPEGIVLAYFASGFLKARAASRAGQVIEQEHWKDGEMNASSAIAVTAPAPLSSLLRRPGARPSWPQR